MKLAGKKDVLIIAAALILCAVALLLFGKGRGGDTVRVYLDDELYKEASLKEDQTITVEQSNGSINEIRIQNGGVYMQYSTCDNQLCIHQGEVTPENAEKRPLGSWIICLPNRVTVELVPEEVQ